MESDFVTSSFINNLVDEDEYDQKHYYSQIYQEAAIGSNHEIEMNAESDVMEIIEPVYNNTTTSHKRKRDDDSNTNSTMPEPVLLTGPKKPFISSKDLSFGYDSAPTELQPIILSLINAKLPSIPKKYKSFVNFLSNSCNLKDSEIPLIKHAWIFVENMKCYSFKSGQKKSSAAQIISTITTSSSGRIVSVTNPAPLPLSVEGEEPPSIAPTTTPSTNPSLPALPTTDESSYDLGVGYFGMDQTYKPPPPMRTKPTTTNSTSTATSTSTDLNQATIRKACADFLGIILSWLPNIIAQDDRTLLELSQYMRPLTSFNLTNTYYTSNSTTSTTTYNYNNTSTYSNNNFNLQSIITFYYESMIEILLEECRSELCSEINRLIVIDAETSKSTPFRSSSSLSSNNYKYDRNNKGKTTHASTAGKGTNSNSSTANSNMMRMICEEYDIYDKKT